MEIVYLTVIFISLSKKHWILKDFIIQVFGTKALILFKNQPTFFFSFLFLKMYLETTKFDYFNTFLNV